MAALGARRETGNCENPYARIDGQTADLVWSIEPALIHAGSAGDRLRGQRSLGQARQVADSLIEEELPHAAWLAGIKEHVY